MTTSPVKRPAMAKMLTRAFGLRCPWCGGRKVLRSWFALRKQCPACGVEYDRGDGFWLGGYVINFGVTQFFLIAFITVGIALTTPHSPALKLVLGGVAESIVVPILFFPFSRTIWAAFDIAMHPPSPDISPEPAESVR